MLLRGRRQDCGGTSGRRSKNRNSSRLGAKDLIPLMSHDESQLTQKDSKTKTVSCSGWFCHEALTLGYFSFPVPWCSPL